MAIQAQFFRWTGILCLAYGLYCGYDPLFIAWRAVLAALIAMIVVGYLMRHVTKIWIDQVAAEQAEAKAAAALAEEGNET